jgi:protease-4
VLLVINGLSVGWATLQSLADELDRFRAKDKRVVAYVLTLDNAGYYTACAADEIIVPPTATWNVLGLHTEVQFLKDARARVGSEAEVEAVSPYKSAGEMFVRSDISPENREQLDRLIDGRYNELVRVIGERRQIGPDLARALIDMAPLTARAAREHRLVDALLYEDELEAHLKTGDRKLIISEWKAARKALRLPYARAHRRLVAVVPVEGTIINGNSRNIPLPIPLFGGAAAGSNTVAQALRQAERNDRVAAVVLHVNSPGGDAFASDLMWREVLRVGKQKPVVVAMGDVAASGGYYIAAPAAAIVAQPATLTGSIGVISLRPVLAGMLERAGINTVVLSRGAHSGLFSVTEPLNDDERQALRAQIFATYDDFKQRVRAGRGLTEGDLEPIAGGRVWSGADALERGLVDQLGGMPEALIRAQELANLPQDREAPIMVLRGRREWSPPKPFPTGDSILAMLDMLHDTARTRVWAVLPFWTGDVP